LMAIDEVAEDIGWGHKGTIISRQQIMPNRRGRGI
jgi:hypothetical protein